MPVNAYPKRLRRYFIIALAGWTLVLGGLLAWSVHMAYETSLALARKEALANFNKDQAFRFWATGHGGVYVPATEQTPPNPNLAHIPERDLTTPSGLRLTLMNPAYMVRQLNEQYAELFGVKGHITSERLMREENAPDAWERRALAAFERGSEEVMEVTEIDGVPHLRFMRPMYIEEGCLRCHDKQGYEVGDLRGGVSVSVPIAPYLEDQSAYITAISSSFLLVWLLGGGGILFGWRRLRRDHLELVAAEEEVNELNRSLEQRVRRRTAELDAANGELEAFAYSVSHDLRSPLNSIVGFSEALLEDYGDQLDETGRDYLRRVESNGRRMDALVEDILKLSRATRGEMNVQRVDMSALVGEVADDLRQEMPERPVAVEIAPGLNAQGDPRLLRVALENLLRNAWKFTGRTQAPRIIFGRSATAQGSAYFVRDNGAGFDMARADKLFTPFKRLHSAEEFPGSGIGLATVQRVINKHGGRIWAEGEPGKGAVFYFTLPE